MTAIEIDKYIRNFNSQQDGSHAIPHPAFFVGGKYHGLYKTHDELKVIGNGKFTIRWSALPEGMHNPLVENLDLEDQPKVDGYLGPMWDGGYLRYETQEVYNMMCE